MWLFRFDHKKADGCFDVLSDTSFPNKQKILLREIIVVTTMGCERNWIRLISENSDAQYFKDISLREFIKISAIRFLPINKSCALQAEKITGLIGLSFAFIKDKKYKIGESYKKKVSLFLEKMESSQAEDIDLE